MNIKSIIVSSIMTLAAFSALSDARAAAVITIDQVGSDVIATGSGTINLTDLPIIGEDSESANVSKEGGASTILALGGMGSTKGSLTSLVAGPSSFGNPSGLYFASSASGDHFGILEGRPGAQLILPSNYVSGTALSDTTIWDNMTLAGLGFTDGAYVWTWGTGVNADSLTLEIGAVPEPSTWAMMILGFCGLGFMAYRHRHADSLSAFATA
ncbi:PEPxxWA-CTERM sorting domain-containing protein [Bradyrhizobium sp. dw_78]|uniref:PEPxxWA-CTERM sorting domain-containing protein n=1 Tax=Bradyrhizobium sp. dw_78 TaxID=2719793 RepID=UPI001BD4BEB2|nr:PEPxxWA-CTERM sorting domain-containing protein [Bradyrhizobium sp. dw_78]